MGVIAAANLTVCTVTSDMISKVMLQPSPGNDSSQCR